MSLRSHRLAAYCEPGLLDQLRSACHKAMACHGVVAPGQGSNLRHPCPWWPQMRGPRGSGNRRRLRRAICMTSGGSEVSSHGPVQEPGQAPRAHPPIPPELLAFEPEHTASLSTSVVAQAARSPARRCTRLVWCTATALQAAVSGCSWPRAASIRSVGAGQGAGPAHCLSCPRAGQHDGAAKAGRGRPRHCYR